MASKKTKAPRADDNLDELFSGIGDDAKTKKPSGAASKTPKSAASKSKADDLFADLESELASPPEQAAISRPHTPRVNPGKRSTATPPVTDDKAPAAAIGRKSTDSARSLRASFTPSATSSELHEAEKKGPVEQTSQAPAPQQQPQQQQSGGGWLGGWISTATATANAAMKQAEAAYKEIQQNEEAKKWAEQVKGLRQIDVGAIRHYGDELRHMAMPTLSNILHTLAPPIGSHERLLIHITHDLVGYPSLDPLIHGVFARVMSQVEGGDLLVVQRGAESASRRSSDGSAGWHDGPWWRQVDAPRELGLVKGLAEGTKLCRASAESYSAEYFAAHGGIDEAKIRATEAVSESNPVRTSDLFLSVQAISMDGELKLFAGSATAEQEKEASAVKDQAEEEVCFAVYILDPVHNIHYATVSQAIPSRWVRWLDAPALLTPTSGEEESKTGADLDKLPDEIREIVASGGVDPREWVAEWIEELLSLSVGVVAQRYVARRMGVGEGGLGKGKKRMEDVVRDNAGEAARAGVI